ncbi:hypothetical protein [Anaerosalibacter massiliensis]|uniref:Toxin regulator n=1 Tax=Anaerosalibacter massiliensis TaxID=1347392 RepID=A0A9X2MK58_9FIRM|nr:hypothetical protein [Anaerosalibacter massiliensis]MCR2045023.1 hypothetical protein [Anaerosalibacter massiliensis]
MKKFFSNKWVKIIGGILLVFIIIPSIARGSLQDEVDKLSKELKTQEKKIKTLETEKGTLETENKKLQEKVDEAKPFFDLSEVERAEEEKKAEAIKAKQEKEKKEKEEAERKKQEEEEKKGYDTGITYNQLARTPDDFIGKKAKFSGKVVQVIEGEGETQLRLAVDSNYDTILLVTYSDEITTERILEDDIITVMGISSGLITYKSTMGGNITIPAMLVNKIEFQ